MAIGVLALCAFAGCAQAPAAGADAEKPELTPELKSLVLDQAPSDIAHPLYVDFNGKAELLGYSLDPETTAAPNSKLTLKLFWRSTGKLDEGYVPFTELVTPDGRRLEIDGSGPVRKGALAPQNWEASKVYIDELEISVPADINAARFAIVVGLKTQPVAPEAPAEADAKKDEPKKDDKAAEKAAEGTFGAVYLSVLSGPSDRKHGASIASVETGITPGAQRALAAKEQRGNAKRPLPPGKLPVSARPARPAQPAQ
jgi:hypothetical protein